MGYTNLVKVSLARVVELVDTLALGASVARREGSSPFSRTTYNTPNHMGYFIFCGKKLECRRRRLFLAVVPVRQSQNLLNRLV